MAIVELAIVAPLLVLVVFTAIDLGRLAHYQNRVTNAAREGAMIAQGYPGSVASGCRGDRNVTDRVDLELDDLDGTITYQWVDAAGVSTSYSGCDEVDSTAVLPQAGDRARVTVRVDVEVSGPATKFLAGSTVTVERSVEMVVPG